MTAIFLKTVVYTKGYYSFKEWRCQLRYYHPPPHPNPPSPSTQQLLKDCNSDGFKISRFVCFKISRSKNIF